MKLTHTLLLTLLICNAFNALAQQAQQAPELRPFLQSVTDAMQADTRTDADRERDANRLPVETLDFFGIDENMRVVELIPGGGWYTKLLAPALRENGKLYLAVGTGGIQQSGLLDQDAFEDVTVQQVDLQVTRTDAGLVAVEPFSIGLTDLDAALTFRNVHNFDAVGRANMNSAVFDALKPGGIYGIVDHTKRHMEAFTQENRRRADPVRVIKEVEAAGFEFVDFSDLHYRPDDELRYEVGRKSVTGNTDRFTLLFKKPE